MKKKLLSIFAIATAFVACNTIDDAPVVPSDNAKDLIINAIIDTPSTKLSYTEKEDGGYKATFSENDALWAYFHDASGAKVGAPTQLPIDYRTVSADGKSASFVLPEVKIPQNAAKLVAYLTTSNVTTDSGYSFGSDTVTVNLSNQANLAASLNNQIICATESIADIAGKDANTIVVNLKLGYKTSLLKYDLSLPEGAQVEASKTTVKLVADNLTSKVSLVAGEACDKSAKGEIVAKAISVDGLKLTAAMSVWAADNLTGRIVVLCNDSEYSVDFTPAKALEPGNVYTIARELKNTSTIVKWVNDEAGSIDFGGGSVSVSNEFLSYENGKLSWTANETGAPRSATISFESGAGVTVTQLAPADFKGNWAIKSKRFNPNGTVAGTKGTDNTNATDLVFGDPVSTEELANVANIGIKGLYLDATMDACLKIDYEAQTVKIGLFLDRRAALDAGNGKFVAFLPECANKDFSWGGYNFAPKAGEFSTTDYDWLWLTCNETLTTFKYVFRPEGQLTSNGAYAICGISCVAATSADAATIGTSYDVIYQANYNGQDAEGIAIVRK